MDNYSYKISSTIKEGENITLNLTKSYPTKDPHNFLEYLDRLVSLAGYSLKSVSILDEATGDLYSGAGDPYYG